MSTHTFRACIHYRPAVGRPNVVLTTVQQNVRRLHFVRQAPLQVQTVCGSRHVAAYAGFPNNRHMSGDKQKRHIAREVQCQVLGDGDIGPEVEVLAKQSKESLEFMRVPQVAREQVLSAVENLGGTVTVGDVAARAGVSIQQAEDALQALAADTLGTLQVSSAGDVLYVIPRNARSILTTRSWLLRAQPTLKAIQNGLQYAVRVSFGTALIASAILVWTTVAAILSSSSKDDNRRDNSSSYYPRHSGGMYFNMTDLLWYWDPYYYRTQRVRREAGQGMNFLEAIFSFVFGDGDPNLTFEEKRWQKVGQFIQAKGGVVTAEELAPYLDLPRQAADKGSFLVEESFVVPALLRFDGSAEVDKDGNLQYVFPSLQATGKRQVVAPSAEAAQERPWAFSEAKGFQKVGAAALGAFNLVGVAVLTNLVADPSVRYQLARSSLGFVGSALPFLQIYAFVFFGIPLVRWGLNKKRNAEIAARNEARMQALSNLRYPDEGLQRKLANARRAADSKVITERDVIYSSNKPLSEQRRDTEADDFDRKMAELDQLDRDVKRRMQPDTGKAYEDWMR